MIIKNMRTRYFHIMALAVAALFFTACDNEDLSSTSVLSSETFSAGTSDSPDFDAWIKTNYTDPYNIQFNYRYIDKETVQKYNVIPAETERSIALAKLVRHMWLQVYVEAVGEEFLKTYTPRIFQLIGSYQYDSNGSQVLGTAEGGLKIYLFGVNSLDIDNPRINSDNPYESKSTLPYDLNYWFFHTLHHEFCHILTQTKDYDTDFRTISAANYHASDWINVEDKNAAKEGFVSGYASGEYNEDFAETYSTYVTMSEEGWQTILDNAEKTSTAIDGKAAIEKKLEMVRTYFQDSWGIDIDKIRDIVIRRASEVPSLDLRTLD